MSNFLPKPLQLNETKKQFEESTWVKITLPYTVLMVFFVSVFLNIDMIRAIDAGKVHGSLARAGKVRGQTPKVAKQDKKKKPRGRAHKRLQYNRRFVTAVVGFGKKRGPNSSEK
ncbi:unnamed protein product [Lupinus luteus]|uniref:40S ribosomal protein S30 n=1 Tax=Lupinus luteus TaxID=3873 RepID=A0AAV1WWT1_LUPLU